MIFYIQIAILASLISLIPRVNKEERVYAHYRAPKSKEFKVAIQSRYIRGQPQIRNTISRRG